MQSSPLEYTFNYSFLMQLKGILARNRRGRAETCFGRLAGAQDQANRG
jgi:hypothetical protein